MWKWGTTAALLLCAATTARAADLETEIGELAVALQARIDAGAGGKERKQLNKVAKKIAKKPSPSVNDLKKILGGVSKSGTSDIEIANEAADVLQCLCDIVQGKADDVASEAAKVFTASLVAKLDGKVANALAKLELAKTFVQTEPGKAAKLLVGAAKKYEKALAVAVRFVKKDSPKAAPNGITVVSGLGGIYFGNYTGKPHNLKDILVSISFRDIDGVELARYSGTAKKLVPQNFEGFANRVFPDSLYDVSEYVYALLPPTDAVQDAVRIQGSARVLLGKLTPFDIPVDIDARLLGY